MPSPEVGAGQTREDQEAILAVILKLFEGLKAGSQEAMNELLLPETQATNIRPGGTSEAPSNEAQILRRTLQEIISIIAARSKSGESMEENIALATWQEGDDGDKYEGRRTEIRVDYDVGMAWTPYEVRTGGKVHHVGTNIFTLVKRTEGDRKGEWAIAGLADTYRLPGKGNVKV